MLRIWGEVKDAEKKAEREKPTGLLGGVPRACPRWWKRSRSLHARRVSGFDWENAEQVLDKLHEELAEFAAGARATPSQDELEDELGDMLFVLVNLARFVKVDPEQALRAPTPNFARASGISKRAWRSSGKPRRRDHRRNGGPVAGSEEQERDRDSPAHSHSQEFDEVVELQRAIWSFADIELLPCAFWSWRAKWAARCSARSTASA